MLQRPIKLGHSRLDIDKGYRTSEIGRHSDFKDPLGNRLGREKTRKAARRPQAYLRNSITDIYLLRHHGKEICVALNPLLLSLK